LIKVQRCSDHLALASNVNWCSRRSWTINPIEMEEAGDT
jgi:hypothetical protein